MKNTFGCLNRSFLGQSFVVPSNDSSAMVTSAGGHGSGRSGGRGDGVRGDRDGGCGDGGRGGRDGGRDDGYEGGHGGGRGGGRGGGVVVVYHRDVIME